MTRLSCIIVIPMILLLSLSGCMLSRVHEDTERLAKFSLLEGSVDSESVTQKSIQVVVTEINEKDPLNNTIVRHMTMSSPGPFQFIVQEGLYQISAFEDADENLTFDLDESVGWYGKPDILRVQPGQQYKNLNITLLSPEKAHIKLPALKTLSPV